jgi:hypothetical protein
VLFIIRQQTHSDFTIVARQSQQDWIMAPHLASPLVQVTQMPLSVRSHLHRPIVRLQQQTIMPFIITQQLHIPPASIPHRSCTTLHAIASSQVQVIFMPPVHFSNFIVHRGTIIQLAGAIVGGALTPGMPIPGIPMLIPVRSIIMVDTGLTPFAVLFCP